MPFLVLGAHIVRTGVLQVLGERLRLVLTYSVGNYFKAVSTGLLVPSWVVQTLLRGVLPVMRDNGLALAERLRPMDDTVDEPYSAINFYLTQPSRLALCQCKSRRWAGIVNFTIHMEQLGDSI